MAEKYTQEQIEQARNTDIIDFLSRYKGLNFKRQGKYYRCTNEDSNSLVVYSDRKGFVWNSHNIKGSSVIDYLQKIENMTFIGAMKTLIGNGTYQFQTVQPQTRRDTPSAVELPPHCEGKYSRVFAYLAKTRCIAAEVINDFIKQHTVYQDTHGNCVFVGYDDDKKARFACIRGTLTEKKYRGDCLNSDKRYSFSQIGQEQDRIYIFESPIDLLSHCTLTNIAANSPSAYQKQTRISLSGTSDVALEAFLERHKKVKTLHFRLDNDEAGITAVQKYKAKYEARGYTVNAVFSKGKDINEDLVNRVSQKTTQTMKR